MRAGKIRVLVVDDSAFVRRAMTRMLESDPTIEVAGTARDGLDALEKVKTLDPDVVTLDLIMPVLDGLGFLEAQMAEKPLPVVLCTIAAEGGDLVLAALDAGALEMIQKPTALALDDLYDIQGEVVGKVKAAGLADLAKVATAEAGPTVATAPGLSAVDLVAIGASTGGPQALRRVLTRFPAQFPAAIAVVIHMPIGFTELFAQHLDEACPLRVVEAADGVVVEPGTIVIARAGLHLTFRRRGDQVVAHLETRPSDALHRPSVDTLFASAAETYGDRALGVVLTGMGEDGLEGARLLKQRGGRLLAEDASTSVVYGMPRAVAEAGLVDRVVPLPGIPAAVADVVAGDGSP